MGTLFPMEYLMATLLASVLAVAKDGGWWSVVAATTDTSSTVVVRRSVPMAMMGLDVATTTVPLVVSASRTREMALVPATELAPSFAESQPEEVSNGA